MGQLLKVLLIKCVASIQNEGCSHLVVVTGTEIDHDMLVPAREAEDIL